MADKFDGVKLIIYGAVGGIGGFILGSLLEATEVFPELAWAEIFLFLGVLFGAFKDKL